MPLFNSAILLYGGIGRWAEKLDSVALMLGVTGNICLAFLFFPVARNSAVLPLLGLTSESSIKYHIWLGNIAMILFTAHGLPYIIYWAVTDHPSEVNILFPQSFSDIIICF